MTVAGRLTEPPPSRTANRTRVAVQPHEVERQAGVGENAKVTHRRKCAKLVQEKKGNVRVGTKKIKEGEASKPVVVKKEGSIRNPMRGTPRRQKDKIQFAKDAAQGAVPTEVILTVDVGKYI